METFSEGKNSLNSRRESQQEIGPDCRPTPASQSRTRGHIPSNIDEQGTMFVATRRKLLLRRCKMQRMMIYPAGGLS
jgi:hypothetical protein